MANGLSCVALGALVALAARESLSTEARLLLITGFCGGFSTFSTFSNELMQMLRGQAYGAALVYLMLSLGFGLLALWVGMRVGE